MLIVFRVIVHLCYCEQSENAKLVPMVGKEDERLQILKSKLKGDKERPLD